MAHRVGTHTHQWLWCSYDLFTFSPTHTDTGDFLRMKSYTPLCPDYTVFSNLALLCYQLIYSTPSPNVHHHCPQSLSRTLLGKKKEKNIPIMQFYLKQMNAGLEINATYLGCQTKSRSAQMETRVQNAPTQLDMLSHFACTHYTHTPSESAGCEQLGHTTESRSRGICQCDGLFGFPGDIKVAWLHVLGANRVCVCVWGGARGRRCVVMLICFGIKRMAVLFA